MGIGCSSETRTTEEGTDREGGTRLSWQGTSSTRHFEFKLQKDPPYPHRGESPTGDSHRARAAGRRAVAEHFCRIALEILLQLRPCQAPPAASGRGELTGAARPAGPPHPGLGAIRLQARVS